MMKSIRTLAALVGLAVSLSVAAPAFASTYRTLCPNVSCPSGQKPQITQVPNGFNDFLQHPEIIPLFWESTNSSYWDNALSTRLQIVGAIQAIVHGPYFAYLEQYAPYNSTNGQAYLAPARMVPVAPVYSGTAIPSPWTDNWSVVQTAINGAICQGKVPPPVPYTNHIYAVFVPPGTRNGDFNNASIPGQANVYTDGAVSGCTGYNGKYNGDTYSWTFVNGTDYSGLFHEFVEDIAGNATYSNCTVQGNSYSQIADVCECDTEPYFNTNGGSGSITIGAYWSAADQACVIPEAWSGIGRYDGSPQHYTTIRSTPVRQVYAGGFGLMATDQSDNPILYSGTPNVWTGIGSPGSMFAVGSTTIMELSTDASTISLYTGGGFTTIPSSGATSVLADNMIAGTDAAGDVYEYNAITRQWPLVGGSGDQFVASGSMLVGLPFDHSAVYANTNGSTSGWSIIGGAAEEMFAGQGGTLAATSLASTKSAYYWLGSNWSFQNGPAMMFALTTSGNLFAEGYPGVTSGVAYPYVVQSSNTNANNPSWNLIEPGGWYYLVGHGSSLYFAAGLVLGPVVN